MTPTVAVDLTKLHEFGSLEELDKKCWEYCANRGIPARVQLGLPETLHAGADVLFVNGRPVGFSVRAA